MDAKFLKRTRWIQQRGGLAFMLRLALGVSIWAFCSAGTQAGDFGYITDENNQISIISYSGTGGAVEIPSTIEGLPVTTIKVGAFANATGITSISIPPGVTSIGAAAFSQCSGLTSINLPEGLTRIEFFQFYGCTSLTTVRLPSTLQTIGISAFDSCSNLTNITIPSNTSSIELFAFSRCTSLTSISLPPSVTSLGDGVFESCKSLTNISLGSVKAIPGLAFSGCISLTDITIPSGITKIGGAAFSDCTGLRRVAIPDSVTDLGESTFWRDINLVEVAIPPKVTRIGMYAFASCSKLASISIPEGVSIIDGWAFYECTSLAQVSLPSTLASIRAWAFYHTALSSVIIPESILDIGQYAFALCPNLTIAGFQGTPGPTSSFDHFSFDSDPDLTIIYPPGKINWLKPFGDVSLLEGTVPQIPPVTLAFTPRLWAGFTQLGNPCINNSRSVAFHGEDANESHTGIWSANCGSLNFRPETLSDTETPGGEGRFASFGDPVINSQNEIAFLATVIPAESDSSGDNLGIWASTMGKLHLVARKGWSLGSSGIAAKSFPQMVLADSGDVIFLANLESGLGGVTPKNNQGIWWEHQGEVKSLLRKGDVLGGGTITSFSVFTPPSHVVGQTRSFNTHADLALKATFSDRTQGIFVLSSGTACVQIAVSGGAAPSISGQPARFGVFGSPILNEQGNTAFLATLSGTARGSLFSTAILAETGSSHELKIVARTGLPAPDANGLTGTIGAFSSFCEPVFNANDQVAFLGKLDLGKGVNAANQWGIWASHLGSLALVVQSQMQAPGCPKGAKFRSFDQIVMGDSGVIFTANLTGASAGIKPSNDQGIWAVDAGGNLRLMARKGDVMRDGSFKVLSGISLFKPSGETSGQTRNFNSARDLIYQVTFTDKTQAIQKVVIP